MAGCCATAAVEGPLPAVETDPRCPQCGRSGTPVQQITLKHMVRPEFLDRVGKAGFRFCRTPGCEVVYFHSDGDVLRKADIRVRVGLKETVDPVPLCYCFGFTEKMVLDEVRATGTSSIPQRITAQIKAGHCACEIRNPQGSCCLGNVTAAVKRAQNLAARRPGLSATMEEGVS